MELAPYFLPAGTLGWGINEGECLGLPASERVHNSIEGALETTADLVRPRTPLTARGGPQLIPRPTTWQPGQPAPWAKLASSDRDPTLSDIKNALAEPDPTVLHAIHPDPASGVRSSAVLAAMFAEHHSPHIVLTRRSWDLRTHKGEISFPGGRVDDTDRDLVATALREAHEEVGLVPEAVEVVGRLDELSTFSSNAKIFPFVGIVAELPNLQAQPTEVDEIRAVPIAELLSDGVFHEELWSINGLTRPLSFFEIEGDTIWGATASMLRELLSRITGVSDAGRGVYR